MADGRAFDDSEYRASEDRVARTMGTVWQAQPLRLPRFYSLSHALIVDRKPICFMDIRIRKFPLSQNRSIMLPLSKIIRGIELQNMTGIPFVLAIQFADALAFCRPGDMPLESLTNVQMVDKGGTPGVMREVEPQVLIPTSQLDTISAAAK
jgi:hypothetical protein